MSDWAKIINQSSRLRPKYGKCSIVANDNKVICTAYDSSFQVYFSTCMRIEMLKYQPLPTETLKGMVGLYELFAYLS